VDELFGLSMTWIMVGLLVLLAIGLGSVTYIALRNRIMFKLGVRNIPRRRAQTTLIVLGLMLSTIIISAAFTTGDTIDHSVTGEIYSMLGSVDETVVAGDTDDDAFGEEEGESLVLDRSFEAAIVAPLLDGLAASENVDAAVPVYMNVAVAVNPGKQLSAPLFNLTGADPERSRQLTDFRETGGSTVRVSEIGAGEIYLNESAAEELDARAGDSIQLYGADQQQTLRVKGVIEDRRLSGSAGVSTRREGGLVPLEVAQSFFSEPGRLTMVAVSNSAEGRSSVDQTDVVEAELQAALAQIPGGASLTVQTVKENGVSVAEQASSIFSTFFLVLGLFSIGAGVLLIFMIFVMLAAERKPEMGMARAVGTKRTDLVQTFLSEGMAYNVLAAAVGAALGVVVSFVISSVMASLFESSNLEISPYVTPRSLIISYSLGVVLTFLTVTFSSWRVSLINIVQAIRDLPESPPPRPMWASKGKLATLRDLFFRPVGKDGWLRRGAMTIALILAAVAAGVPVLWLVAGLIVLGVCISFAWSQKALPPLFKLAVVLGAVLVLPLSLVASLFMTLQLGPLFVVTSLPLIGIGASEENGFALLFGLSLLPLGLSMTARAFGANDRLVYTLTGLWLIFIWEIDFSVGLVEAIFGEVEGGPELFFLSGVMVTIAATFIIVYNAELILGPLTRLGGGLGALLPSLKMAVAYPLANKMRTGMTMAMFCLVVFALVMISAFNHNFNQLFRSDRALGGWDIVVEENPSNPILDVEGRLTAAGSPAAAEIESTGISSILNERNAWVCQLRSNTPCEPGADLEEDFTGYEIRGESPGFLDTADIGLQARATGFDSDQEVWEALAANPNLAVIDVFALQPDFGTEQVIRGIEPTDETFEPITLRVLDSRTGEMADVQLIGVIQQAPSGSFSGLHLSQATFDGLFGQPDARRYFIKTVEGADNVEVAREIEAALLTAGAQAESLRQQLEDQGVTINGFFYLMQGFMGLGLFVGVAAVGVIAFRTVVERRQQIGMLRAIGYTRNMIGLTFLLESAFIAFMGVLSGIVFALILAYQLLREELVNQGGDDFSVPWLQIAIIGGLAFGSALLMTLIPSRQAGNIPIAQALRYE
jgi:putative ABC transport system permease protein